MNREVALISVHRRKRAAVNAPGLTRTRETGAMSREVTDKQKKPGSAGSRKVPGALALAATLGVLFLLTPRSAEAQASTFYLDRLFMPGAPDDATAVWRPKMHDRTRFYGQL